MTTLAEAILFVMTKAAPPGKSVWSVEPVPATECAMQDETCPGAKWSSHHRSWVRKESEAAATARYTPASEELAAEVDTALLREGKLWGEGVFAQAALAGLAVGIMVNESGLREDVLVGRVSTEEERKGGLLGAGRGPSGEVCYMQILPKMTAAYGGVMALLGPQGLRPCFRAALDQITHARMICGYRQRQYQKSAEKNHPHKFKFPGRNFQVISLYGTGTSCLSDNEGKTQARLQTATWATAEILRKLRS